MDFLSNWFDLLLKFCFGWHGLGKLANSKELVSMKEKIPYKD